MCCFVLLTRGWGRLETRPPIALRVIPPDPRPLVRPVRVEAIFLGRESRGKKGNMWGDFFCEVFFLQYLWWYSRSDFKSKLFLEYHCQYYIFKQDSTKVQLCPSSHACSNSTYNTNNIVLETEGTMCTGLIAGQDILPNEIIEVFGNMIILQERGLVQEFTKLINTYNMDHPTRGFQYSIFYQVARDSYPSVVIPDLNRELAHGLPNLAKQLRSHLQHGSSTCACRCRARAHKRDMRCKHPANGTRRVTGAVPWDDYCACPWSWSCLIIRQPLLPGCRYFFLVLNPRS